MNIIRKEKILIKLKKLVSAGQLGYRNSIIVAVQAGIYVFMLNLPAHKLIREIENDVIDYSISRLMERRNNQRK